MPCTSSAGVVRVLACANRPVASSKAIRSVKVPPISIATSNRSAPRSAQTVSWSDERHQTPLSLVPGSEQYLRYHDENGECRSTTIGASSNS